MSTIEITTAHRELAHRSNDGIEVVLFWHEPSGKLTVTVSEEQTGQSFELSAEPELALDVFNHPFAYAAARQVATEGLLQVA